ncbi:flagellar basal body rod protein FlgC [Caulobacter sp. DWR1-3-2b1]|uniref:flagellar basal body rod protein FlgC n=1 Tax=Caulobacter sp. DWR1-3-2b1 TaxID=2804670 RepID=UPI003CFAFE8C
MRAMEISRSGLDVEWRRLEVIAQNLANAGATRGLDGGPYKAMRLISGTRPSFSDLAAGAPAGPLSGVSVVGLEPIEAAPRRVHEPGHPDADAGGFVSYPGFDHAAEMTLLVKTARVYEANLVALNVGRQIYSKALDLGKRS